MPSQGPEDFNTPSNYNSNRKAPEAAPSASFSSTGSFNTQVRPLRNKQVYQNMHGKLCRLQHPAAHTMDAVPLSSLGALWPSTPQQPLSGLRLTMRPSGQFKSASFNTPTAHLRAATLPRRRSCTSRRRAFNTQEPISGLRSQGVERQSGHGPPSTPQQPISELQHQLD